MSYIPSNTPMQPPKPRPAPAARQGRAFIELPPNHPLPPAVQVIDGYHARRRTLLAIAIMALVGGGIGLLIWMLSNGAVLPEMR